MENPENLTVLKDNEKKDNANNILNEVKDYDLKQMFIITKEIELKIPLILSYLENDENEIINKLYIIKYLISLIQNIPYNLKLILAKKSDKLNLNLYEIIIKEYIYAEKNENEYIKLLKDLISLIFKKLSLDKDIYRYMLSYVGNFLNKKNNNEKNNNFNFNEYNYNNLLELLLLFYQSKEDEDPINYFLKKIQI